MRKAPKWRSSSSLNSKIRGIASTREKSSRPSSSNSRYRRHNSNPTPKNCCSSQGRNSFFSQARNSCSDNNSNPQTTKNLQQYNLKPLITHNCTSQISIYNKSTTPSNCHTWPASFMSSILIKGLASWYLQGPAIKSLGKDQDPRRIRWKNFWICWVAMKCSMKRRIELGDKGMIT